MRFLLRALIVFSIKKVGCNYKNNHEHSKLANFQIDLVAKLIVIS